jgi:hypothetical protein
MERPRRSDDSSPQAVSQKGSGLGNLITHQEIFLRILAFLDTPESLAAVQGVNKYWAHMAIDPQVSLYSILIGIIADMFSFAERFFLSWM